MNGMIGAFAGLIDKAANETGRDESNAMQLGFLLQGDRDTASKLANADVGPGDVRQLSALGWLWYLNYRAEFEGAPPPSDAFLDALFDMWGDHYIRSQIVDSTIKGAPETSKPFEAWTVDDIPMAWVRHRFLTGRDLPELAVLLLETADDYAVAAVRALLADGRAGALRDRAVVAVSEFVSGLHEDVRPVWLAGLGLDA